MKSCQKVKRTYLIISINVCHVRTYIPGKAWFSASFDGVELIFNDKINNKKGLELLLAIKKIDKIIDKDEKILLTLVFHFLYKCRYLGVCIALPKLKVK